MLMAFVKDIETDSDFFDKYCECKQDRAKIMENLREFDAKIKQLI